MEKAGPGAHDEVPTAVDSTLGDTDVCQTSAGLVIRYQYRLLNLRAQPEPALMRRGVAHDSVESTTARTWTDDMSIHGVAYHGC